MNGELYKEWALTKEGDRDRYAKIGLEMAQNLSKLRLMHASMGITGEAGELMDAIKKHIMYNKELDLDNVKEELGDLCWYMAIMLDTVGSSFEEVMKLNFQKLEKRYPSGYSDKFAALRLDKNETGETAKE